MNEQGREAALVVEGQRLLGIFTERDVLRRIAEMRLDLDATPIGAMMSPDPDTVPESTTLAQALRMLAGARYRHLPVVDAEGYPVSVISLHSLIEFVSEAFPNEILNAPPEKQSNAPPADGA